MEKIVNIHCTVCSALISSFIKVTGLVNTVITFCNTVLYHENKFCKHLKSKTTVQNWKYENCIRLHGFCMFVYRVIKFDKLNDRVVGYAYYFNWHVFLSIPIISITYNPVHKHIKSTQSYTVLIFKSK